jgi:hypothetical protein
MHRAKRSPPHFFYFYFGDKQITEGAKVKTKKQKHLLSIMRHLELNPQEYNIGTCFFQMQYKSAKDKKGGRKQ